MLILHMRGGQVREPLGDLSSAKLPEDAVWVDLLQPTPGESTFVERTTGLRLPTLDDLNEIESSSRLQVRDRTLFLSLSLVYRTAAGEARATPVGFILGPERLITVRFEPLNAFSDAASAAANDACEAFAALLEAIIDRIADALEHIAAELDNLSHRLFLSGSIGQSGNRRRAGIAADLRQTLRRVGASGDLVSKIRNSLLGLARLVSYVGSVTAANITPPIKLRLETMSHDIASLSDYDAHLDSKVQLLLDATLGLINVDQNDIIKVLTIVSVVGVPPTLIASMYGMNFKTMPEYDWAWGYAYGLAMIAISAIAPLIWFKVRGWF